MNDNIPSDPSLFINLNYFKCRRNPEFLGNIIASPNKTKVIWRHDSCLPYPQPPKPIQYDIKFDQKLQKYLINVYIGAISRDRQNVSIIVDTSQDMVLIPTNCCMDTEVCFQNLGMYFFYNSPSCLVKKINGDYINCYQYNCSNIQNTVPEGDNIKTYDFGTIRKVTIYDYLNFSPQSKHNERVPMELILDSLSLNAPYIPPTLGVGPKNILGISYIYLDLKNNKLAFGTHENPKYILSASNDKKNYTGIISNIAIYGSPSINLHTMTVIFDTGMDMILFPSWIYQRIKQIFRIKHWISEESPLWSGGIEKINYNAVPILSRMILYFKTQTGDIWECKIDYEDYFVNILGDIYTLLIGESDDNKIRLGTAGMRGKRYGFINGVQGNLVYIYE